MKQYVARRLLLFIPSLLGLTVLIFVILRIVPGDPAQAILEGQAEGASYSQEDLEDLRAALGLDKPLPVQYVEWIGGMFVMDWGKSLFSRRDVLDEIKRKYPLTLQLALWGWGLSLVIGIPIGIISAVRQDTWVDYSVRSFAIIGLALPSFWVAILLIIVMSRYFNYFPPLVYTDFWEDPFKNFQQTLWPALALGLFTNATKARMTRTYMLEVLRQDYVRTAYAKGLVSRVVILRHALKNALIPVVTISGVSLAQLLGGTVIIESIFTLPGLGRMLIQGIATRDFPIIQGGVLLAGITFLVMNLFVDITYSWLDPRIRLS